MDHSSRSYKDTNSIGRKNVCPMNNIGSSSVLDGGKKSQMDQLITKCDKLHNKIQDLYFRDFVLDGPDVRGVVNEMENCLPQTTRLERNGLA